MMRALLPAPIEIRRRVGPILYEVGPWLTMVPVLAVYTAVWGSVSSFVVAVDGCQQLFCDFVRHFLPTGHWLYPFKRPAVGFVYPPFAAVLFAPFGDMSPVAAQWIWGALQLAATAALVAIPGRALLAGRPWLRCVNALLVATALPVLHCFKWGQVSVVIVALALGALWLRDRGRMWLPAMLLAAAASIKLYPALLLVHPLLRRDLRFVATTLGCAVVFTFGLPSLLMGPAEAWQFWLAAQSEAGRMLELSVWRNVNSQFLAHVAGRLWNDADVARGLGFRLLGLVVTAANITLLWRIVRARVPRATWWAAVLCFGSVPFLIETSWPHYFAFLPLVQVQLGLGILDGPPGGRIVRMLAAACWMACVAGSSAITLIAVGHWQTVSAYGFVFFANLAALVATWLLLVRQLASHPHRDLDGKPGDAEAIDGGASA